MSLSYRAPGWGQLAPPLQKPKPPPTTTSSNAGSIAAAREKGLYRMEGKDYTVRDGDVILFKFNVQGTVNTVFIATVTAVADSPSRENVQHLRPVQHRLLPAELSQHMLLPHRSHT